MLYTMYTLKNNIIRLKGLNNQIKDNTKDEYLKGYKGKFNLMAIDSALMCNECALYCKDIDLNNKYNRILHIIDEANKCEKVKDFKDKLKDLTDLFDEYDYEKFDLYFSNNYAYDYSNNIKCNRTYEIVDGQIGNIFSKIIDKIPNGREINLFFPKCDNGNSIKNAISVFGDRIKVYGNESDDYRLKKAKEVFTRVVKGSLLGSRIQNNAFDIIYTQPDILIEANENNPLSIKKIEKEFMTNILKYLRVGGIFIALLPVTRLFKDTCNMLAKNLDSITICKVNDLYFDNLGFVYIIGQKNISIEPKAEESLKLRRLYDITRVKKFDDIEIKPLPKDVIEIELFRGSQLDLEEIGSIINKSNLMKEFFISQKAEKLSETVKNPLLPFNIGQLGLVLTSGCLDGVVVEGNDNFHLIKGRVAKKTIEEEDFDLENNDEVEITETVTNKVEINVLLPNGEFKTLA